MAPNSTRLHTSANYNILWTPTYSGRPSRTTAIKWGTTTTLLVLAIPTKDISSGKTSIVYFWIYWSISHISKLLIYYEDCLNLNWPRNGSSGRSLIVQEGWSWMYASKRDILSKLSWFEVAWAYSSLWLT